MISVPPRLISFSMNWHSLRCSIRPPLAFRTALNRLFSNAHYYYFGLGILDPAGQYVTTYPRLAFTGHATCLSSVGC